MALINNDMDFQVITSGDLASQRRTIGGLLGQFEIAGLDEAASIEILKSVGLPEQAFDDPSFPISLEQDFGILNAVRKRFSTDVSLITSIFALVREIKLNLFGVLGLAMQSAPTLLDAIAVPLNYPQLNWGRSRMIVKRSSEEDKVVFELERSRLLEDTPGEREEALTHGILLDLTGAIAILNAITDISTKLTGVTVQVSKPDDWHLVAPLLEFDVEFDAEETAMIGKRGFFEIEPVNAHRLSYKSAMQLVEREASMLADEISFRDRVSRWLWAYTPPLKKGEIANLMGLSERSLTRQLAKEGTNYNLLFAQVQAERAENLLANDDLSISEVGYRLGYTDPAAFTRAFTGWKNMSPSQWRQQ